MSNKLYDENYVKDIADAIRSKNGSSKLYTIPEMADAIKAIEAGGEIPTVDMVEWIRTGVAPIEKNLTLNLPIADVEVWVVKHDTSKSYIEIPYHGIHGDSIYDAVMFIVVGLMDGQLQTTVGDGIIAFESPTTNIDISHDALIGVDIARITPLYETISFDSNTSDGTILPETVLQGYVGYANGERIVGTYEPTGVIIPEVDFVEWLRTGMAPITPNYGNGSVYIFTEKSMGNVNYSVKFVYTKKDGLEAEVALNNRTAPPIYVYNEGEGADSLSFVVDGYYMTSECPNNGIRYKDYTYYIPITYLDTLETDTSDGTITPETVLEGYIGYSQGERIEGAYVPPSIGDWDAGDSAVMEIDEQTDLLSQLAVVLASKGAGGGGNVEQGEISFDVDTAANAIIDMPFRNTHEDTPILFLVFDASDGSVPISSVGTVVFVNYQSIVASGVNLVNAMRYGMTLLSYVSSSGIATNSTATFTTAYQKDSTSATNLGYFITNEKVRRFGNSTSFSFRAGRTYKWIAIWL